MNWIFSYEPLPSYVANLSKKSHTMGLNSTQDNLIVMMFALRWTDAKYDIRMRQATVDWVAAVNQATQASGAFNPFLYLNYAGDFQDPLGGYGAANVKFMKQVAKKYNPEGVFQQLMPGGFKISQAG